jgi:uncharacterized surface protein with fasciclin (FAS1) repeats
MNLKQLLLSTSAAAFLCAAPSLAVPVGGAGPAGPVPTIAQFVAANGGAFDSSGRDFDILLTAVTTAGLAGALDDPNASLTLFAPNDAAFVRLARDLGYAGFDEQGSWQFLVSALTTLGGGNPLPVLTDVLLYHVAPGDLDANDFALAGSTSTPVATLLAGASFQPSGRTLIDNEPNLANGRVWFPFDVAASNGRVHTISRVLLPIDLP